MIKNKKGKLIIVLAIILILCGCTKKTSNEYYVPFTMKYEELSSNNWQMFVDIEHNEITNETEINFNAYSFDNKKIESSYARILKNNELIKKLPDVVAFMSNTDEYRNDIKAINEFFKTNHFDNKIKLADLDKLNIASIDKNDIIKLYNKAITKDDVVKGPLINVFIPSFNRIEIATNQDKYLVYYNIVYGNIYNFSIDYTDYDSYLNDKKVLNESEQTLKDALKYIEKVVMDNNTFNIKGLLDKTFYKKYGRLVDGIEKIDDVQNSY